MTDQSPPGLTPSQTVGPFFAYGLTPGQTYPQVRSLITHRVATADAAGERISLTGRVLDGAGEPVPDAMIEIWQPDGGGRFAAASAAFSNAGFRGFGRVQTDTEGRWTFKTVKPGSVIGPGARVQAPHVAISLFARGLLNRLITRIYFADEVDANAADPVLDLVPAERRHTLLAWAGPSSDYHFDFHLQGAAETVFFEA